MTSPAEHALQELSDALGDRYRAERELGRGGMGTVYLARDLQLDRNVAIKVLPSQLAEDVTLRERFVRETRVAAGFSHPNIVPVHAVENRNGVLAFVMGFVEGESLTQRVARTGPMPWRECLRLLQDVAYALAYAHGRGVVHRDVKPDNIMLERASGRALLMDFGVSRNVAPTPVNPAMTRVGEVVGTPEYMSPEQAAGEDIDGRSDVYSLGLTAYFALLGKKAYSGDSVQRLLVRQLTEAIPPIASLRADIPPALAVIIDKCLEKDRNARFATAEELVDAIEAAGAATPDVPLPVRLFAQEAATLGLVITFMLVFLTIFTMSSLRNTDSVDPYLLLMVLVAILGMRVAQTFGEARRLFTQGFTVNDVMRGFRTGLDERESRRVQLRADPVTRRARTRSARIAALLIVAAPFLIYFARSFRVQLRPGFYAIQPMGLALAVIGLLAFGFGLPLMLRSPLRKSIGERLFQIVWLGIPGEYSSGRRPAARGLHPAQWLRGRKWVQPKCCRLTFPRPSPSAFCPKEAALLIRPTGSPSLRHESRCWRGRLRSQGSCLE